MVASWTDDDAPSTETSSTSLPYTNSGTLAETGSLDFSESVFDLLDFLRNFNCDNLEKHREDQISITFNLIKSSGNEYTMYTQGGVNSLGLTISMTSLISHLSN